MGTGGRIRTALAEAQCPDVKIHFTKFFTLDFPRPDAKPAHTTEQATEQVTQQVTQQVRNLLGIISEEMGRIQMMEALELKDRVNFSNSYLEPALAEGLLEMTQPEAPRSPTQKYRLTEKGRILLAQLKKK